MPGSAGPRVRGRGRIGPFWTGCASCTSRRGKPTGRGRCGTPSGARVSPADAIGWRGLRRLAGLVALRRRRYVRTVQARHPGPAIPNRLAQQFAVPAKNRVWAGDLTYIPTRAGWLYVAVLVDLYSRRVVGWAMSEGQSPTVVIEAWLMAWHQRRPPAGLLHHSDQGKQYTASLYQALLARRGVVPSLSRKGSCYDNAPVESFFSTLKNELVRHRQFQDQAEARHAIFEYIEGFYNRRRLHQALGYRSPEEFEQQARDSSFTCLLFQGHLSLTPNL